jgi:FkbM family methyltransferase
MLIPLRDMVLRNNIKINGVLHVGAHEGEENDAYLAESVPQGNIYWVEAIPELAAALSARLPNVYNEAVSDRVEDVEFKITNNNASSSILELKDHLFEHPDIDVVRRINVATTTLDSIVNKHKIQANFLSMDIQGAELKCLQGFEENLKMIDTIYTEVNTRELYAGCVRLEELDAWLGARGFVRREICMTYHGWGDALYVRQ